MVARASPKLSPVRTAAAAAARGLKRSEATHSAAHVAPPTAQPRRGGGDARQHSRLLERLKALGAGAPVRPASGPTPSIGPAVGSARQGGCSPGQAQRPPGRKRASVVAPAAAPRPHKRPRRPSQSFRRSTLATHPVVTDGECSARPGAPGAPGLGLEPEPLLLPPYPHRAAAAHQRLWADTSQR